ncbi:MAG: hypothetical protein M1829_003502 [Trizodia sp. TS-e1964]|nr:MAG: hypothetical protein M1829_003502 [Trizodia sp. TS-e1964]
MPSHLTRHVFRRILSNEAYVQCRHQSSLPPRFLSPNNSLRHHAVSPLHSPPRRSIFGFSRKRVTKEEDLDPGLRKMMELNMKIDMDARPPPATELANSFRTFFRAKQLSKEPLLMLQVNHAINTFAHLRETNTAEEGFGLSLADLLLARDMLVSLPGNDSTESHNRFARILFEEIKLRREKGEQAPSTGDMSQHIRIIASTGDALEARGLVEEFWRENKGPEGQDLWLTLMACFSKEANTTELLNTLTLAFEAGIPWNVEVHRIVVTHFARSNDVAATKEWYAKPIDNETMPSADTNEELLNFCIRNNEMEWGEEVFQRVIASAPSKRTWDVIFRWAAAVGKGVDEVDRMMDIMERRSAPEAALHPDIDTFNQLVAFANEKNDPYMAERYVALGEKRGIKPNGRTYILQMDYRIKVADLGGAKVSFEKLQAEPVQEHEDLPVINKFLQALCASTSPEQHHLIDDLVDHLNQRGARLEPDTVAALSLVYLKRQDQHGALDLLNSTCYHYTPAARSAVRDVFLALCLDSSVTTARAWDAYRIFIHVFDETPVPIRTQVMAAFFARRRADLAVHVFSHMHSHPHAALRPTEDTYVACFQGLATRRDLAGLEMVHNLMKLDVALEPSTRLYNALMAVYTACDLPQRSLAFWEDITNSREGPSDASIQLALQACEVAPFGAADARKIWAGLRRLQFDVSREIVAAYVAALAGQMEGEEARQMVEGVEEGAVDALLLGTLYNATPRQDMRDEVEEWAKGRYPAAWAELESLGQKPAANQSRKFRIQREVVI